MTDNREHPQTARLNRAALLALVPIAEQRRNLGWPNQDAAQRYLNSRISEAWFQDLWGLRRILVEDVSGANVDQWGWGDPERGIAYLTTDQRHLWALTHELAHCLCPVGEDHGPVFARVLLIVWEHLFGPEDASRLEQKFAEFQVTAISFDEYDPHGSHSPPPPQ